MERRSHWLWIQMTRPSLPRPGQPVRVLQGDDRIDVDDVPAGSHP